MSAGVFHIENKVYMSFSINDTPVSPSWNLFSKLLILNGFGLAAPQLQLTLNDMHGYLTGDLAVNDGTKITVTVGKKEDLARDIDFIVFGIKHHNEGNSNLVILNCIIDAPKYLMEAGKDVKKGSSMDALKDIAQKSGLTHVTDLSTSDTMTWLNCGEPRHVYAQRITDHAWNGNQTCVVTTTNIYKEMMTKDLFECLDKDPQVTFCYSFDDESTDVEGSPITVMEVCPVTISGAMNSWTNYGHSYSQHSMSGKDLNYEKANPLVLGDGLPLNKDLKSELEGSQLGWGSFFDVGCDGDVSAYNLHKYYYEADYLNTRHRALFTEGIRVSIDAFTELKLFDTVKYVQTDNLDDMDQVNPRYEGKYVIGGQAIIVEGHHYVEVLDLYRSFVEESGKTNIVGSSSTPSSSSASTGANTPDPIGGQVPVNSGGQSEDMLPPLDGGTGQGSSSMGGNDLPKLESVGTDNKFKPQVDSVTDKTDAIKNQASSNSAIDDAAKQFQDIKNEVTDRFTQAGDAYKTPEFLDKYGENADYLDALMREFSRAKDLLSSCKLLGDCELISLKEISLKTPAILDELESRAEFLENKLGDMENTINDLINSGAIPDVNLEKPTVSLDCLDLGEDVINGFINDILPDKCFVSETWDKIDLPKLELSQLLDKIKDFIRDLLCTMGKEAEAAASGEEVGKSVTDLADDVRGLGDKQVDSITDAIDSVKDFGAK